jgi:hypothetical protein
MAGGGGNDTLDGGLGNDTITGGAGNDIINGGLGLNIAEYTGAHTDYTISGSVSNLTVVDKRGVEGTDTLSNIEYLHFSDGYYSAAGFSSDASATTYDFTTTNLTIIPNPNQSGTFYLHLTATPTNGLDYSKGGQAVIYVYDAGGNRDYSSQLWIPLTYNSQTGLLEGNASSSQTTVLPATYKSGIYDIAFIYATAANQDQLNLNQAGLNASGCVTRYLFTNPNADNTPPTVNNIVISNPVFNTSSQSWVIDVNFHASDTSGIIYDRGINEWTGGFGTSLGFVHSNSADGYFESINSISSIVSYLGNDNYNLVYTLDKGFHSGNIGLELNVTDKSQNIYRTLDVNNNGSIPYISFTNPYANYTAPILTSWMASGKFDDTDPNFQRPLITVSGQFTGPSKVVYFSNRVMYPGSDQNNLTRFADYQPTVNADGTFTQTFSLANPSGDGLYSFSLNVIDSATNTATYWPSNLTNLGFSGAIPIYAPDPSTYNSVLGYTVHSDVTGAMIFGGLGPDILYGDAGSNNLYGGKGNDYLFAGDGNDIVDGGTGDDLLVAGSGAGDDTYIGGNGTDTIKYNSAIAEITIDLTNGFAHATAGDNSAGIGFDTISSVENIIAGNYSDVLIGGSDGNSITGGAGNDTIDGGGNVDTAIFSGTKSAYTITQTSTGIFTISGADGTDILKNIEFAQFDDQTNRLLPGILVKVDFTQPTASYMSAIRDFDGNDLGAASSWQLIGSAIVNNGGTPSQILLNPQNGRWAVVTPQADGQISFDNYGWAGDTRVVGIYIDPEVTLGHAVQGGPNDSQRRFQNDIYIGNLSGVLGYGNYSQNGLQEVYFSITDGTAVLHAYMWADGNIQYANYQSIAQAKTFLTSNGFGQSTWGSWPGFAA